MKKNITIIIIVLLALGFGYFLFKISPEEKTKLPAEDFDLTGVTQLKEPAQLGPDDHVMGNVNAKNTMVVYEDFQCPACLSFRPTVDQMPTVLTDTKVVFRHYPLIQIHQNAAFAAYASESASAQGKFWEMYDQLYNHQSEWSNLADPNDKFAEYAGAAGVANLDQFKSDLTSKKYKPRVQKDIVEAVGLGVGGTPTLYFNGQLISPGTIDQVKAQAEKLYK